MRDGCNARVGEGAIIERRRGPMATADGEACCRVWRTSAGTCNGCVVRMPARWRWLYKHLYVVICAQDPKGKCLIFHRSAGACLVGEMNRGWPGWARVSAGREMDEVAVYRICLYVEMR